MNTDTSLDARVNIAFEKHFKELTNRHPILISIKNDLFKAIEILAHSVDGKKTIFCAGNGGSHSDSDHIVGELLKGFLKRRPICDDLINKIEEFYPGEGQLFSNNLQMPISAISLMGSAAFQSAFANDMDQTFSIAQHLLGVSKTGDALIAISTSGNSKNIVLACKMAKVLGVKTIALTGESGGQMAKICDVSLRMPSQLVHHVQELHLPTYHAICLILEDIFFEK